MLIANSGRLARNSWRRRCARSIAGLLLALPASAQDPGDPADPAADTKAIPITGETDRDVSSFEPPFRASDLHEIWIEDFDELGDYAPNLAIDTSFASTNPTVYIRGIGIEDDSTHAGGAIGVYHDGVNINSPAIHLSSQTFDLEAVEVLRGPQGSVDAHNASAGAVLFRSARPDGAFGVETKLSYGNYDAKEVEAAVDIPLLADVLSLRVSGRAQWRDGYTKNQCAGWDPTRYGLFDPNEGPTRELYESLQPAGNWVNGELVPVNFRREMGQPVFFSPGFVFLDWEGSRDAQQNIGTAMAFWGTNNNPTVLAEDLYDQSGNLVAPAGTRVGVQTQNFRVSDQHVDQVCYMKSAGTLSTMWSEYTNPGNPSKASGAWVSDPLQPGSRDFAGVKRWTNDVDNWAARMVLLFEPLDNMEWMLNAHGSQNRGDSAHLQMLGARARHDGGFDESRQDGFSENLADRAAINLGGPPLGEGYRDVKGMTDLLQYGNGQGGGNPFSGFYDSDGLERIDAWGINGHGLLDLGPVVVRLLYDYEWYDRVIEDEGDATPLRINPAVWSDSAWQTTTDLRAEGEGERYRWTAGFFFLYEELSANHFFPDYQLFRIDQDFTQKLTSLAPYLTGELDLVEEGSIPGVYAFTFSGGIRYNREKKEYTLSTTSVLGACSVPEGCTLPTTTAAKTWHEPTGDVQLSYTPFSNAYGSLLSYLRYGRGFTNGHYNEGLTIRAGDPVQVLEPVEPEFNDALEFGIRTRWFDERVIFDAAVFRYWYRDLQVFDIVNEPGKLPTRKLLNSDADVRGAEFELHLRPLPGLVISGNLGWLDSKYEDFTVTKTIQTNRDPNPIPVVFDYSGNPLVNAPEWNLALFAEYEIPLFGWGFLVPHYDANYRSEIYFDPQQLDPISQAGYWLHNARIAYRTPDERIELAFWVRNLFQEEYKLDTFDHARSASSILELWAPPRTYGVTLSLNW